MALDDAYDNDEAENEGEGTPYQQPDNEAGGSDDTPSYRTPESYMSNSGAQPNAFGAPTITPGGQPGPGEGSYDNRSRYTASFPGGHQMTVIGGGSGQPRPPGGNPMPAMGQELSWAEEQKLSRLQGSVSQVQERVDNGLIDFATGQAALNHLKKQIAPLQARKAQQAIAQAHQQSQLQQTQLGLQDALMNEHNQHVARALPGTVSMLPGPMGQARVYRDNSGKIHPTPDQEQEWKLALEQAKSEGKHDPAQQQSKADDAERKDFEAVYKLLTKKEKGADGGTKETPPSLDEVHEHRAQRDLLMAEGKGPQEYAHTARKYYPDGSKAPQEVRQKLFKIAYPNLSTQTTGLPQ
jgi:hypothetical protein